MATEKVYSLLCCVRACENCKNGCEELMKKAKIVNNEQMKGAEEGLVKTLLEELKQKVVVLSSLLLQSKGKRILQDHNGVECLWKWRNCLTYDLVSKGFEDFAVLESHLVILWELYALLLSIFPTVATVDVFLCNTIAVLIDNAYVERTETSAKLEECLLKIHPNFDRSKAIVDNWDTTADKCQQVKVEKITSDQCILVDSGLHGYEEALKELIKTTSGSHINLSKLSVLEKYVSFLCLPEHTEALIDNIGDMMGIVDIRVRQTFLRILKSSVENLGFDERQRVMAYYYAKHGVINMSESYDGFNAELNAVVNSMLASKDITGEQLNKAGSALADRLCWLFLLGGKRVLWRLFQLIQEVSAVMPIVIRAFIDLRPALHARVDQNQTTLIMAGLKRLLDQTGPANNNQRTELITKFALELINATLVDATAFIKICLLSGLTQNQSIEWAMASLSYLNALLNNNHVHIDWTNYLVDEDDDNPKEDHWEEDCSKEEKVTFSDAEKSGLNPAPLYLIVFQLIGAASLEETLLKCPQFAYALQDICIETLGNIAENLGRSNFEMSEKGLMAAVIAAEKIHWAVRLFITQSLTNQAHIVKHKVPVCVKMTLKLDEKLYETFQCQESHSSVVCTMESLVQCGAFSGKLLQILQTDFDRNVLAEHKKEIASHLAIAVANVIPTQRISAWRSVIQFIEFFDEVIRDNQATVYTSATALQLSEGLQQVGLILILGESIVYRLTQIEQDQKIEWRAHMINCYAQIAKEACQQLRGSDTAQSSALLAVWTITCRITKYLRESFARTMGSANSLLPTKPEFNKLQELLNDILKLMATMVKVLSPENLNEIATEVKVFPDGMLKSKIEDQIASLKP